MEPKNNEKEFALWTKIWLKCRNILLTKTKLCNIIYPLLAWLAKYDETFLGFPPLWYGNFHAGYEKPFFLQIIFFLSFCHFQSSSTLFAHLHFFFVFALIKGDGKNTIIKAYSDFISILRLSGRGSKVLFLRPSLYFFFSSLSRAERRLGSLPITSGSS